MRKPLLAFLLMILPSVAMAQASSPPLTAQQFEDFVTGRTLTYAFDSDIYGIEEYLPNRKVRWQFSQDICQYGQWYQRNDMICFEYEQNPTQHCWRFWQEGDHLRAQAMGDGLTDSPGQSLAQIAQSDKPLSCPGPNVGV